MQIRHFWGKIFDEIIMRENDRRWAPTAVITFISLRPPIYNLFNFLGKFGGKFFITKNYSCFIIERENFDKHIFSHL